MNKINKILIFLFILTGVIYFNSCVKEKFDAPANTAPTANLTANMTIAQFNQFFIDTFASTFGKINQDIILKGVVAGNDQSGNIYKNLYIEDTTGGLDIAINGSCLYTTFRVGQVVYVKCKDLYIGNYSGTPELGYVSGGAIYFMPLALVNEHLFLDGFPGNSPAPKIMTISDCSADCVANPLPTNVFSTLIRLDSVYFSTNDVGHIFAVSNVTATNHILFDKNGNQITVRTSDYANFAGKLVPKGTGSVNAIFSNFNGTPQLTLRDSTDLIGFQ